MQMRSGHELIIRSPYDRCSVVKHPYLFEIAIYCWEEINVLSFGADCKQTNVRKLHILRLRVSNLHKKQTFNSLVARMAWQRYVQMLVRRRLTNQKRFFVSIDTNNQSACSIFGLWHASLKHCSPGFFVFTLRLTRVTRTLGTRLRKVPSLSFNNSIILCSYFSKRPRSQIRHPWARVSRSFHPPFSPDTGGKNGGFLSMRTKVILESPFARPGLTPM